MKSHHRTLFAFFVLLLAVSLACSFGGSSTPTQSPNVQPPVGAPTEQVQQPSPAASEAPVQSSSQEFFTEDFNGDISSNWTQSVELSSKDGNTSEAKIAVDNGYLVFDFGKELIGYEFYQPHTYKNVRIDVRVDNRGTNVNNILLVCRKSDKGHYLVNIANSGLFGMYAFDGARKSYTRIADGGSNKIKSGKEINDYTLVCNDKTLILYINGFETRSYTDNQFVFREGQIGIGVASENQVPVKVEFDSVKVSAP